MTDQASLNDRACDQETVPWSVLEGSADFQHRGQLNQLGFVFVGVVLAEQQLTPGWQRGTDASSGAAAVAAVSPGQFRTGKRCVHGASVLA
jgi:hypothetical protein